MNGWLAGLAVIARLAAPATERPGGPQPFDLAAGGFVIASAAAFPRLDRAVELRSRVVAHATVRRGRTVALHGEGAVEGLLADRDGRTAAAIGSVRDAWIEVAGPRGDLRAGYGRLVWGRLDEIQPSDVINPLDAARFFFDGRGEARLPVAFVRGRLFAADRFTAEAVAVPVFRRARADELAEATSPFNLLRDLVLPAGVGLQSRTPVRLEPRVTWANLSGGARVATTAGRVDLAASVYRGFDPEGVVAFEPLTVSVPGTAVVGRLVERYPRFTMIAGDFETVRGKWALRGEAAVFTAMSVAAEGRPGLVPGHAVDAGFGLDRGVRNHRVFASVIVHRRWSAEDPSVARTDVSLVGVIERPFARARGTARVLTVVTPDEGSAFLRGFAAWSLRDNVAVEASGGVFLGSGEAGTGRFRRRDFVFSRLRWSF